ncbi:MAG TPA: UDP-glucose--hexose-1-phosphate uridylyltransferase [Acidobacteriota bacterium]|jgi:UDPglucose--hexose-1-phosphate uridylyltransferase
MIDVERPHRRYNPLVDEWVLCSPQRTLRPWLGQTEPAEPANISHYDPSCYLCPGNARAGGIRNPRYTKTFVFDNDFAALLETAPDHFNERDLLIARAESGNCRVICFSPRHDLTVSRMDLQAIEAVVDVWTGETQSLGAKDFIGYVQIFENKGAIMGCSNAHPHCQIWATGEIPTQPARKMKSQQKYFRSHNSDLLGDYLQLELTKQERIVCENQHWVALVPFWAYWPYECMLIPRRLVADLPALSRGERAALAEILKRLTTRYDNLFQCSFPYSMGWHGRPTDGEQHPYWRLHAVYYPPLLRSATVKKFAVGYEMMGEPQRDISAEVAAACLREVSERHYLEL